MLRTIIPDSPHTLAEMLVPLLQCPACGHIISQPTTLICGHTVCSKHVTLTPTESAATHFPKNATRSVDLPSCPILTCFQPSGPRPLRKRDDILDSSINSSTPNLSSTDDPASTQVIYVPPPTISHRVPPPPHAKVKVPYPKLDVTLSKVLDVLARFVDFDSAPNEAPQGSGEAANRMVQPVASRSASSSRSSRSVSRLAKRVEHLVVDGTPSTSSSAPFPGPVKSEVEVSGDAIRPGGSYGAAEDVNHDTRPSKRQRKGSHSPAPSTASHESSAATRHDPYEHRSPSTSGPALRAELSKVMSSKREELTEALLPELTCEICYQLFFDPVTTPCQHVSMRFCVRLNFPLC